MEDRIDFSYAKFYYGKKNNRSAIIIFAIGTDGRRYTAFEECFGEEEYGYMFDKNPNLGDISYIEKCFMDDLKEKKLKILRYNGNSRRICVRPFHEHFNLYFEEGTIDDDKLAYLNESDRENYYQRVIMMPEEIQNDDAAFLMIYADKINRIMTDMQNQQAELDKMRALFIQKREEYLKLYYGGNDNNQLVNYLNENERDVYRPTANLANEDVRKEINRLCSLYKRQRKE